MATRAVAVLEAAKAEFGKEWVERIGSVVDPKEITAIVCDHTEPDHAGALYELLKVAPNAVVYSSRPANGFLKEILNRDFPAKVVKQGDEVDLGNLTLRFIDAPFLHWPDSIFTYIPELETLVSGDVFGYHYGKQAVFAQEDEETAYDRRYYFDAIFGPYVQHVLSAVAKIRPLAISTICPSHGPGVQRRQERPNGDGPVRGLGQRGGERPGSPTPCSWDTPPPMATPRPWPSRHRQGRRQRRATMST